MDRSAIENLPMAATYARHLARLLPGDALFENTGLSLEDLDDPNFRITVRQALGYIENALKIADEPDWYLEWISKLSDHFHGPTSAALANAPTLGDGIDAFVRYFPSRIPYMHVDGSADDHTYYVEMQPLIDLGSSTALLVETPLLILHRYLETVYDIDSTRARLRLAYPAPAYADRYERHFRCAVSFGARRHVYAVPIEWRNLANLGYIESNWAHAVNQCEALTGSSRERETLGEVHVLLNRAFALKDRKRPLPVLNDVAAALHITPRTLIRRLRALDTSYQQIIDDFLRTRAQELLENEEITVKEVAAALGFDDPANFGKAFKRWCGTSPDRYRKARIRQT